MAERKGKGGAASNVVAIDDAARELRRKLRHRDDPLPALPRGPDKSIYPNKKNQPPNWTPNRLGLPSEEPCPVTPLGVEGNSYHLIDSGGRFRSMTPADFTHAGLQSLFGMMPNYPKWAWPRYGKPPRKSEDDDGPPKPPPIESFEDDKVRDALFLACERMGLFSPTEKLRGRGGWRLAGGQFIYHAGEELWVWDDVNSPRPKALKTGLYQGHLYPRLPELPSPWTEGGDDADDVVENLFRMLASPNWRRGNIDALLLLGWIGVAYYGGALDWRSAVLMTGDKGWGKSTLQADLKTLFGDALFDGSDVTKASIFQDLEHDTRPVAVDELEPDAEPQKVAAVVSLMRVAASGAITRRGSSGGQAKAYQVRSGFLFSAINNPLSFAQDFSRVAVLRLQPLPETAPPRPAINPAVCGRVVLARLMHAWPRFEDIRDAFMQALAGGGHDARGQKTYGTLLACAEAILGASLAEKLEIPLSEDPRYWQQQLAADSLPEVENAKANWRGCLEWLLSNRVEYWRGVHSKHLTVGALLRDVGFGDDDMRPAQAAALLDKCGLGLMTMQEMMDNLRKRQPNSAEEMIAELGLTRDGGLVLAVPNQHPAVAELYAGSQWQGQAGGTGPWCDALRQCPEPGVMLTDRRVNRVTIGGVTQTRCTLVVLQKYRQAVE